MRKTLSFLIVVVCLGAGVSTAHADDVKHVDIYRRPGEFAGWPANHGIWRWQNEILVGFARGTMKDNGIGRHAIDHDKPEEHMLARSLDGGETWTIEDPGKQGFLVPKGKSLHGIAHPELPQKESIDCPGSIDFMDRDFVMTLRMTDIHVGPSRFFTSTDRGRTWNGPYKFPNLGTPGIAARTDYIVNSPRDCLVFLTAGKKDLEEGRLLCARTIDGGKTWNLVSYIGEEPKGFEIMPSTVRLAPGKLFLTSRVHEGTKRWIDAWRSDDDGLHWQRAGRPVDDTGTGNPPSLLRLKDGRLCVSYGVRAKPFRICAKTSSDEGKTWSNEIVLRQDGGGTDIGYPRSVELPDGKVVVIYYFHTSLYGERFVAASIFKP